MHNWRWADVQGTDLKESCLRVIPRKLVAKVAVHAAEGVWLKEDKVLPLKLPEPVDPHSC